MVAPVDVIRRALGRVAGTQQAYNPFQIHGFPAGHKYPASSTAMKLPNSDPLLKGPKHMLAYAIISQCVIGTNVDGERSFFRFQPVIWGEPYYALLIIIH